MVGEVLPGQHDESAQWGVELLKRGFNVYLDF